MDLKMGVNHRNQLKADDNLPLNRSAGSVFQPLQWSCETSNAANGRATHLQFAALIHMSANLDMFLCSSK